VAIQTISKYTLAGHNQEAYNSLVLYLMQAYRKQGQEGKALLLKNDLLSENPRDLEITNRIKYFDLQGRWKGVMPNTHRLSVADSTDLVNIAGSGTTIARSACLTLRLFYPQLPVCEAVANQVKSSLAGTGYSGNSRGKELAMEALGQSYPNPTQGEAVIPYNLPKGTKTATLTINDVITGKIVKSYKLPVEQNQGALNVDLRNLNSGLYTYTLLVNEKPVATRKLAVQK
jgi:hypothetical protein